MPQSGHKVHGEGPTLMRSDPVWAPFYCMVPNTFFHQRSPVCWGAAIN
jgi:hypothetical protein